LILNESDDLRFIFFNLDYNNSLKITGDFGDGDYQREVVIEPSVNVGGSKIVNGKKTGFELNQVGENVNQLLIHSSINERHKQRKQYESKIQHNQPGGFSIDPPIGFVENIRGILLPPRWAVASEMEKQLRDLTVNKQLDGILSVLRKVDSSIQNLIPLREGLVYVDLGLQRLIPINLLGDGVRRLLTILLTMYHAKDGIVLIDEIDNGLHFSAQKTLWKAIIEGTKQFNVQLFCTTHNYETVRNLTESVMGDNSDYQQKIRSYTIRKNSTEISSYMYDYEKLGFSIQQGIEFR
jgi:hypothetical protein